MKSGEREQQHELGDLSAHKVGRSFVEPRRPLGADLLDRTDPRGGDPEEGLYGRATTQDRSGHGLPERAKCIAVLRKADELMAEGNPPGDTEQGRRRALELACGRCGVKVEEFERMMHGDEELEALYATLMEAAALRASHAAT
ncbi:MAG TPA: hypothetical protein VM580_26990 [Labilithrix sp.]|jgi:hypothetical protein|nr:hypothetical protein [Labilithrix sp.]